MPEIGSIYEKWKGDRCLPDKTRKQLRQSLLVGREKTIRWNLEDEKEREACVRARVPAEFFFPYLSSLFFITFLSQCLVSNRMDKNRYQTYTVDRVRRKTNGA